MEEEVAANSALGAAVAARVEQLARPAEAERYRAAVEQVTTITNLLLGLAGRLETTEAALTALPGQCPEEKVRAGRLWLVDCPVCFQRTGLY